MKEFIFNTIESKVCCESCTPKWIEFQVILPKLLDSFDPKVSQDGVKISYQEEKGRYSLSIMRFLTRKLRLLELITEKNTIEVANFITQRYYSSELKIRLDTGVKITENYKNRVGGGSCMCGSYSKYTRLYEMNPDRFEHLIIVYNNGSARAIIAKLDNGEKFACRTYRDNSVCMNKLESYVREQGWCDVDSRDMIVSDLKWIEGGFPYQDNFTAYHIQSDGNITIGTLRAFEKAGIRVDGDTDVQYGYLEEEPTRCYHCRERIEEGCEVYIGVGDYCETCVNDIFSLCNGCGDYVHRDDVVLLEDECYCESCSQDAGSFCEHCEVFVLSENIKFIEDEGGDIEVCNECYENVSFTLIREKGA